MVEQVAIDDIQVRVDVGRPGGLEAGRRELRDQLEALEHAGREHRAQDQGRGRQVVRGDPGRQREPERRQERPVRPNAVLDRLRPHAGGGVGDLAEDDPEGLPVTVLHQDGLARFEVAELGGDRVRVRPGTGRAGGVDRDLDEPSAVGDRLRARRQTERHR